MDSFEFFKSVSEDKNYVYKKHPLTREEILDFFEQSRSKIDIFSGEMFMFNDIAFTEQVDKILSDKEDCIEVHVACGNRIIGLIDERTGKPVNPFLKMLNGRNGTSISFNSMGVLEQIANGYVHAIIIDGGRLIYLEEPHSYNKYKEYSSDKDKTKSLLIEGDYDLGIELIDRYESYKNFDEVSVGDFEIIEDNTYSAKDFFDADDDGNFENRQDFERLWLNKLEERYSNSDDAIISFEALDKLL